VTPVSALNTRWKWKRLSLAACASAARLGMSRASSWASSINRHALRTVTACRSASVGSFGRQRLQGRKPARSASAQVAWKDTFSRRGSRAAQVGRQ
jgi:hypothetical protein